MAKVIVRQSNSLKTTPIMQRDYAQPLMPRARRRPVTAHAGWVTDAMLAVFILILVLAIGEIL